tara:strand:- start:903 stop:1481 length:579 start_codon:yes stop_codon:yes gene_type:complete
MLHFMSPKLQNLLKIQELKKSKALKNFQHILDNPKYRSYTQNSVAVSVAIGLFCGLLPAPFQMLSAATASYLFQTNILIAVGLTLYSNPMTIVPLYYLGYKIGESVLGLRIYKSDETYIEKSNLLNWQNLFLEDTTNFNQFFSQISTESFSTVSWNLIVGNFILAISLAVSGFILTHIIWQTVKVLKNFRSN